MEEATLLAGLFPIKMSQFEGIICLREGCLARVQTNNPRGLAHFYRKWPDSGGSFSIKNWYNPFYKKLVGICHLFFLYVLYLTYFIGISFNTLSYSSRLPGTLWKKKYFVLIPQRESARRLQRGPIEYSFHFIGIGNCSRGFKNTCVNRPFWKLENVLFDGVGWVGWGG